MVVEKREGVSTYYYLEKAQIWLALLMSLIFEEITYKQSINTLVTEKFKEKLTLKLKRWGFKTSV